MQTEGARQEAGMVAQASMCMQAMWSQDISRSAMVRGKS